MISNKPINFAPLAPDAQKAARRLLGRYVKTQRKAALSGNCRVKFVPDIVGIYEYSWFTYVGVFK